jgi:release factor glutamine methyltransferase
MTICQIIAQLAHIYPAPEAENIAWMLTERVLGLGRMELKMQNPTANVADEILQPLLARLLAHEPIQYVLGEAHFYGYDFWVSPATLIPRRETEELVFDIIQTIGTKKAVSIIDIGTGTGCIPVSLMLNLPLATLYAIDISPEAVKIAQQNAQRHQVKIEFAVADILNPAFPFANQFDCVVSNPPYVLENEKPQMNSNVLYFEPHTALFVPNDNPLIFYNRIAALAIEKLNKGGYLFFEINEQFPAQTQQLLEETGFKNVVISQDMQGKYRMAKAQKL